MINICVIGNSHVASLKGGWDLIYDYHRNIKLTFFASRRIRDLDLKNGMLIPCNENLRKDISHTSGGKTFIDPRLYDAFINYGMGLQLPELDTGLSRQVCKACCASVLLESLNGKISNFIQNQCRNPIYIGHNPQLATENRDGDNTGNILNYESVISLMSDVNSIKNSEIIYQPSETIQNGWSTYSEYCSNSDRLDVGDDRSGTLHEKGDNSHMNKFFGKIWLENLISRL